MNVAWPTPRCIFCLGDGVSREHLIPDCLRGRLTAAFLCSGCNSRLGHTVENNVRHDPMVRVGLERLAAARPELAADLREGLPYVGHSEQGSVPGYLRDGQFVTKERKLDDGSLIAPPGRSLRHVKNMASRDNMDVFSINVDEINHLPSGHSVETAPGIEVRNWVLDGITPELSGFPTDPAMSAKVAFEFLALHCGDEIYVDSPQLAAIRQQVLASELAEEDVRVERLSASNDRMFHGLAFEGNNPGAQVQIRLFGSLVYLIQFCRLRIRGPRTAYTHDLTTDDETVEAIC